MRGFEVPAPSRDLSTHEFLAGGGEMGARTRALDWTRTPLGDPAVWPQSLKAIIRMMLHSRYAMWMLWGPELTFFCNDAYLPTVGIKKDWVLGARSDKVWEEIWPDIGPRIAHVLERGEATWDEGLLLFLERSGFLEETYHTFSYSPIHDDTSRIAGMLCVVTEVSDRVIGERRLRTLRDLAARTAGADNELLVCEHHRAVLSRNPNDLPFSALYVFDEGHQHAWAAWHTGIIPDEVLPGRATYAELDALWPLADLEQAGRVVLVENFKAPSGEVPAALWADPVRRVLVLPVRGSGLAPLMGFLIVGLSPRLRLDEAYQDFLKLIASQVAAELINARAYETERKRAEALLEIDHAKTTFFSNVSHELRTPLTLILGPLADTLTEAGLSPAVTERIELAHRNSLRLLRLVNALLDFSRIEAGRAQANHEPTDLAALTRNLASLFRSTIERAGLSFEVSCETLPQPVHVDRDMWEQIVLNLLSNAFKFTLAGSIQVKLFARADIAVLCITDTGVGVPEEELPRLFERFYRVKSIRGRTHEGTGIGLALVQELVKLQGGEISVKSRAGQGTSFSVEIPFSSPRHLSDQNGAPTRERPEPGRTAEAFLQEASRWLSEAEDSSRNQLALEQTSKLDRRFASTFGARIVLADDNADMRSYVCNLLAPFYGVEAVADGAQALRASRRQRPDLILSDVMMPNLDGFGLIKQVRSDPSLQGIPVILLSARAGEGSLVEGLDAGADDYLVKPFAGRELLARVGALIELTQMRQSGEERLRLAIDGAKMGTWDWNLDANVMHWSASQFEALGYETRPDGLASYEMWRVRLHPDDADRVESQLSAAMVECSVYEAEYRIIRADTGEVRWLSVYGRALGQNGGTARRNVGVLLDITDRKKAEQALSEADRKKDEFLATLAHELRNPLGPIRNAARILGATNLAPQQLAWCREVIHRQTEHMALLLDDLLDVSRITLGRLQLKRESVEVARLVDSAVETARPLIDRRGHRLLIDLPEDPLLLEVDPLRIAQVLANLLTNAAKYMDPGGEIRVTARAIDGAIEIAVDDTGIGLDQESLQSVFVMFSQVDSAIDRSEGGLGIGLALVKGLVELHGGTVHAESAGLGRGSRFILRLPGVSVRAPISARQSAAEAPANPGYRILVADDNRDAAESLAMLLEMSGHEVRTAEDGEAALAVTEQFLPHAAFIDIGMPRLNGYEVAKRVRREAWGASVRLIALTGWGQDDNKRQALESGFDHHLTKPVDPNQLDTLLERLLKPPQA
jgi:PAS domain S-box-containing protein